MIRRINIVVSKFRNITNQTFITSNITEGVYMDLKPAFERCKKKYGVYCPCARVNEGSVAFKCQTSNNEADLGNLTIYSHK